MDLINCPRCNQALNQTSHRLIKENCGHHKCRQCLIEEDNGCADCYAKSLDKTEYVNENSSLDSLSNRSDIDDDSAASRLEIDTDFDIQYSDNEAKIIEKEAEITPPAKRGRKDFLSPKHLLTLPGPLFECQICNRRFKAKNMRKYHVYCDKSFVKPYQCDICGKRLVTKSHLKHHLQIHSIFEPFKCSKCGKTYIHEHNLRIHEKIHEPVYNFNCPKCDSKFPTKQKLKQHEKNHGQKEFKCSVCPQSFSLKGNLLKHQIVHSKEKHFKCDTCGNKYARKAALRFHKLTHKTRAFKCEECSKYFSDAKALERHLRIHMDTKEYACSTCGLSSTRKDNVLRHIRNIHPEVDLASGIIHNKDCSKLNKIKLNAEKKNFKEEIVAEKKEEPLLPPPSPPSTIPEQELQLPAESERVSVIQSIGNVKPVKLLYKHNKAMKLSDLEQVSIEKLPPEVEAEKAVVKKSPPEKYDAIEIYRRILQPSNDEASYVNDESGYVDFFKRETKKEPPLTLNFSETHWRNKFFIENKLKVMK